MSDITRRSLLITLTGGVAALAGVVGRAQAKPARTPILVFKDPSCGCCQKWVEHMAGNGFVPSVTNGDMPPIKKKYNVPSALESCHTAAVGGYVIEGHVPADLIHKVIKDRPPIVGLAVPGMPVGSPGMEGGKPEPYSVLTFDKNGKTAVYAKR